MKVREELRTFTDEAHKLALAMIQTVDEISLGTLTPQAGADRLDRQARDMRSIQDTIKDLAYRLGRGDDRVTTVQVSR